MQRHRKNQALFKTPSRGSNVLQSKLSMVPSAFKAEEDIGDLGDLVSGADLKLQNEDSSQARQSLGIASPVYQYDDDDDPFEVRLKFFEQQIQRTILLAKKELLDNFN